MRLFISIKIPEEIRKKVLKFEREISSHLKDGHWNENIHLTLSFLGDISDEYINSILNLMDRTAKEVSPFKISLEGISSFPDEESDRVLWVGIGGDMESVSKLNNLLTAGLVNITCLETQHVGEFVPHITLGRFCTPLKKETLKSFLEEFKDISFGEFEVDRIYLNKSELDRNGAIHTNIGEILFVNNPLFSKEGAGEI